MLRVELDHQDGIALLVPEGRLSATDFDIARHIIDPYIEKAGKLNGIIIHVKSFPGWDSFSSLLSHLEFVKDHHKNISHVALVTDSAIGNFASHVASHFIDAKVKKFPYHEFISARNWITGGTSR